MRLPTTPFSLVLRKDILTVHRVTLTQYGTLHLKEGERWVCTLVLCSLATVTSWIDPSVQIVTKSPKIGPLFLFSISLIHRYLKISSSRWLVSYAEVNGSLTVLSSCTYIKKKNIFQQIRNYPQSPSFLLTEFNSKATKFMRNFSIKVSHTSHFFALICGLISVFRIRIRIRIRMFLGLPDPRPDCLVTTTVRIRKLPILMQVLGGLK